MQKWLVDSGASSHICMLSRLGWKEIHAEHATTMSLPLH